MFDRIKKFRKKPALGVSLSVETQLLLPRFDWDLPDHDGFCDDVIELSDLDASPASRAIVALADLPPGCIPEEDNEWQQTFSRESIFPPIVVECSRDYGLHIVQGNHRVIMWRRWGFTHAPAFLTRAGVRLPEPVAAPVTPSKPLDPPNPQALPVVPEDVLSGIAGLDRPGSAAIMPAPRIVEPVTITAPEPEPENPDMRLIDRAEEARTDLPPRSPGRIAFLLKHETREQTTARNLNDSVRYRNRRG